MHSPQGFLDSPPVSYQTLRAGFKWGKEAGHVGAGACCTWGWAKG